MPNLELEFHLTIGALEVGLLLSIFLSGIITMQAFKYFSIFTADPRHVRVLVFMTWVLECAHSALTSHFLWYTLRHMQPDVLFPFSFAASICLTAITDGAIQAHSIYRVWQLMSGRWLLVPVVCWVLDLFRFSLTLWVSAQMPALSPITVQQRVGTLGAVAMFTGASLDVLTSAVLCRWLWRRRQDGPRQTKKLLARLIISSIQTGLLTSVVSSVRSICFLTMGSNLVWLGMQLLTTKLYSTSMLASLNLRTQLWTDTYTGTLPTFRIAGPESTTRPWTAHNLSEHQPAVE